MLILSKINFRVYQNKIKLCEKDFRDKEMKTISKYEKGIYYIYIVTIILHKIKCISLLFPFTFTIFRFRMALELLKKMSHLRKKNDALLIKPTFL